MFGNIWRVKLKEIGLKTIITISPPMKENLHLSKLVGFVYFFLSIYIMNRKKYTRLKQHTRKTKYAKKRRYNKHFTSKNKKKNKKGG